MIAIVEGTVTFAALLERRMLPLLLGALLNVTLQVEELPPLNAAGLHVMLVICICADAVSVRLNA